LRLYTFIAPAVYTFLERERCRVHWPKWAKEAGPCGCGVLVLLSFFLERNACDKVEGKWRKQYIVGSPVQPPPHVSRRLFLVRPHRGTNGVFINFVIACFLWALFIYFLCLFMCQQLVFPTLISLSNDSLLTYSLNLFNGNRWYVTIRPRHIQRNLLLTR